MPPLEYRRLGQCGLKVSAISIGGWLTFGEAVEADQTKAILTEAIDAGINFIDLADVYAKGEAEREAGRVLKAFPRHELVISSKVFWPMSDDPNDRGLSRKHIMQGVEGSLQRLDTDYLDVYFCHREDPDVPLEETMRAMDDLVHQGKILHWGTSCWRPPALRTAHRNARRWNLSPPVVEQPRYNLLHRGMEKWLMPVTRKLGMGLVVYSPLAGGVLTGKYNDGIPTGSRGASSEWLQEDLVESSRQRVRTFCALAKENEFEPAQLALAWLLRQDDVASVITGATSPEQLRGNLGALEVDLNGDLRDRVGRIFS